MIPDILAANTTIQKVFLQNSPQTFLFEKNGYIMDQKHSECEDNKYKEKNKCETNTSQLRINKKL
jgi:hypothetical protein